jgi:hypothetical protein
MRNWQLRIDVNVWLPGFQLPGLTRCPYTRVPDEADKTSVQRVGQARSPKECGLDFLGGTSSGHRAGLRPTSPVA